MAGLAGFAVELDIYDDAVCGDTSADHVGIDDLGPCPSQAGMPTSLTAVDVTSSVDLGDTHWHTAEIVLASGVISVLIDAKVIVKGVALTGLSAGAAYYLGFTVATGNPPAQRPDKRPGGYRQEVKNIAIAFPTPRCL